jgi:hypothetical protein
MAKASYQNFSTQLIDKAGLLQLKRMVDFGSHLERVREIEDRFNFKVRKTVSSKEE